MPSVGRAHRQKHGQGVGLTTALTGERKAKQETCVLRSLRTVAVEHSRSCTYRLSTTTCMSRSPGVDSLRSEPLGFEAPFSIAILHADFREFHSHALR